MTTPKLTGDLTGKSMRAALALRDGVMQQGKGNTMNTPIPELTVMEPLIEPGAEVFRDETGRLNPFHHDAYHMGMGFSRNVLIMMANHEDAPAEYMILVNRTTGERVEIRFPENWQ